MHLSQPELCTRKMVSIEKAGTACSLELHWCHPSRRIFVFVSFTVFGREGRETVLHLSLSFRSVLSLFSFFFFFAAHEGIRKISSIFVAWNLLLWILPGFGRRNYSWVFELYTVLKHSKNDKNTSHLIILLRLEHVMQSRDLWFWSICEPSQMVQQCQAQWPTRLICTLLCSQAKLSLKTTTTTMTTTITPTTMTTTITPTTMTTTITPTTTTINNW